MRDELSDTGFLLSVCVVTYNQEKYIDKCLQSIVDQLVDFDLEILVSDDGSTDKTREIVLDFHRRYPLLIKPIFREKNIGPYENFVETHRAANGDYIAHMDGDDYMLPGKLQIQKDYLDKNIDCNIVWHKMRIVDFDDVEIYQSMPSKSFNCEKKFYKKHIIQYIAIGHNSSTMYRNLTPRFESPGFEVVDYFANVFNVRDGYAKILGGEVYGVYRKGVGISSAGDKTRRILSKCFSYFVKKYPKYRLQVNTAALVYLLADLKNGRKSFLIFVNVWLKTFHPLSIFNFIINYGFIKNFNKGDVK